MSPAGRRTVIFVVVAEGLSLVFSLDPGRDSPLEESVQFITWYFENQPHQNDDRERSKHQV